MKKTILISSMVIGVCMIVATAINSGTINLKDEHVIQTTQGEVKLGNVYKESRLLSISIEDENGNKTSIIEDGNPDDYGNKIGDYVDAGIKAFNDGKSDNHKLTRLTAAVTHDGTMTIEAAMEYHSEYQSSYKLVLDSEKFPIKSGDLIYNKIMDTTASFVKEQRGSYDSASYIK